MCKNEDLIYQRIKFQNRMSRLELKMKELEQDLEKCRESLLVKFNNL